MSFALTSRGERCSDVFSLEAFLLYKSEGDTLDENGLIFRFGQSFKGVLKMFSNKRSFLIIRKLLHLFFLPDPQSLIEEIGSTGAVLPREISLLLTITKVWLGLFEN